MKKSELRQIIREEIKTVIEGIGLDDIPESKLLSIASKSKNSSAFIMKLKSMGLKPNNDKTFISWYNSIMV